MRSRIYLVTVTLGALLLSVLAYAEQRAEDDPRWDQAVSLQNQGQYVAAAALFQAIFGDYPGSQWAALRVAICQEKAGWPQQALAAYGIANAVEPFGYWAEVGLYYQALLYRDIGDPNGARERIDVLRERFPDSRWTARGAVLEAELDGADPTAAEAALAQELQAWERFKAANQNRDPAHDPQRIELLKAVIVDFPDTGTALQALETVGHLLIRNGQRVAAIDTFLEIINGAKPVAPQSRVVETASTRLAALYHATGRKEEALEVFTRLADCATNPPVISNAAVQAAGLYFELLQARRRQGQPVGSQEWAEVRRMCRRVQGLGFAKLGELARADLMIVESYHWEGKRVEAFKGATRFLATYDHATNRREVATVHLVAGECLQIFGRHVDALDHYRWIEAEFGEEEIWPGLTNLQRTYYRIYDALRRGEGSEEEVSAAADFVLTRWPDSEYAAMIRGPSGSPGE